MKDTENEQRKPVKNMEWLRNWSWRLAIIALPWQTRLMFSDASIYASWFFMILAIFFAWRSPPVSAERKNQKDVWMGMIVFLLVLASAATSFPTGTWQWWVQILLLGFFSWSIIISRVDAREFLAWNVIALVPHALLAIQQGITQQVIGTKWLGIAPQLPETRGVAVVEVNGIRHLRAYGGMPYPNILGGWLALGLPVSLWLTYRNKFWIFISCLFTVALILTHSRSAWIACVTLLVILAWRWRKSLPSKRLLLLVLCSLFTVLLWQWPMLTTRISGEGRLEALSISERVSGVQTGFAVFFEHPWFGIGRDAFAKTYAVYSLPHNIFLLAFAETGIVGMTGTVFLLVFTFRSVSSDQRKRFVVAIPLIIIAMVDHYFWSYWSGQTLVLLCATWVLLESKSVDVIGNS